jgi:uncharacterized membrane protein YoaK (UPF0700 family)
MLVKGHDLVHLVKSSNTDPNTKTDQQWYYVMLVSLALIPFVFGAVAELTYGWIGKPMNYLILAVGIAVFLSILAVISKTPMLFIKIVMNFLVALDFGVLIPLLVEY